MIQLVYVNGVCIGVILSDEEKVGCVNSDVASSLLRIHALFDGEGEHAKTRGKIELTLECIIKVSDSTVHISKIS